MSTRPEGSINIAAFPEYLERRTVLVCDGREIHAALGSKQHYQDWIKARIRKYEFEEGVDYLIQKTMNQVPHQGGERVVPMEKYLVSLDMAKELAMVEKTPMAKKVRRYFIDCERQMIERAIWIDEEDEDALDSVDPDALAIDLASADIKAINRQAYADVAGENAQRFHRRREALLREQHQLRQRAQLMIYRPSWAR